jgi:hypothetical protein
MPNQDTTPIFVVGYMHSGTTLLKTILGADETIYTGEGETRFFDYLPMIRQRFANLDDAAVLRAYLVYVAKIIHTRYGKVALADITSPENLNAFGLTEQMIQELMLRTGDVRDHAALFCMTYDYLCARAGKLRWLEKTPTHLFHINTILKVVPEARFVALVRDPRDTLASKQSRANQEWLQRFGATEKTQRSLQSGYDPLWDTIGWQSAWRAIRQNASHHPKAVQIIHYEELVSAPELTVQRMCAFLGMEYQPSMLAVGWTNTTDSARAGSQGISSAAVGKWQRKLTPAAVALCQLVAHADMRAAGYTLVPQSATARAQALLLVGRSAGEFFERIYRRTRWGGVRFMRTVLGNYWRRLLSFSKS